MNGKVTPEQIEARRDEIRAKRIATLLGAYQMMRERFVEVHDGTTINKSLVAVLVEEYIQEREKLVLQRNITGRIQRHKVAGLMAAAIVKFRPVQLLETEGKAARYSKDNEALAVLHGIAVCAEGNIEKMKSVLGLPDCGIWFEDFAYLFRSSPLNSESIILIFETLSLTYFPENLKRSV
jgi:hypothetical protein